jgi:hypothetical protein
MPKIGFWQLLLDDRMSWWEAQAINSASDQADIAAGQANANAYSLEQMQSRLAQLGREVVMLRTAMTVLVNTLRDTNVVDPHVLELRLQAAVDEATEQQKQQATKAATTVTCIKCRQQVPAASTTMTGDGPMCDRCPGR